MRRPSHVSGDRRALVRSSAAEGRLSALLGRGAHRTAMIVLLVLLLLSALGGGTAFPDAFSLLYLRPAAALCLAGFLLLPIAPDAPSVRVPAWLLAALAVMTTVQLVPLPPALWTNLPGRTPYLAAAAIAGAPQPWRPISLTPDLTWNSLIALVVPAAVLIGIRRISAHQMLALVPVFVGLCVASAVLGVAQFAGGTTNPLYWYRLMNEGLPDGLFSNRNHQAVLLGLIFPALRVWVDLPTASAVWDRRRPLVALAIGLLVLPVILATGSRAGLALSGASLVAALFAFPAPSARLGRFAGLARYAVPAVFLLAVLGSVVMGRAVSIDRLAGSERISSDLRFEYFPVTNRIIARTFPFGTGQGSFDPVYRQYEPASALNERYANHAHNDLQEIVMTLGLGGALLVLGFLVWLARASVLAFARDLEGRQRLRSGIAAARFGAIAIALLLAASIVDYPLRTPLMDAVFVLLCGWLSLAMPSADAPEQPR